MHPHCNGLRWPQQQQIGLQPSCVPCVSKRTSRPLTKNRALSVNKGPDKAVHDGRMPFWKTLEQYIRPRKYTDKVLDNHAFAWGKTGIPPQDALIIGDLEAVRSIGASEMQLGVRANFPPTFSAMLGETSIAMTDDLNLHARLRQIISISFTKESIQALLPQLQQKAATHLARWAAATAPGSSNSSGSGSSNDSNGSTAASSMRLPTTEDGSMILGYPAVRLLTFDVLVNCVLGLHMTDQEVQQYEVLFKDLINGFMPPMLDLPFTPYGKGLKAREQIVARVKQTLSGSNCSGALARMREEFGDESPVTIDNTINLLFAGFDTTSSSLSYMMFLLAQHPEVLAQVQAEQAAVVGRNGPTLTPEAYADMPYSMAVIKETLRLAQIIPNVPRIATKELQVPGGPTLPAGCPFVAAFEAIGRSDPALQKSRDGGQFKPERWLDPAAVKSLSQYQLPFGTGQRTCLGINLAYAEMEAVLAELSRNYSFVVDVDTQWNDMPIKNPANGLPLRLAGKTAADVLQARTARKVMVPTAR